MMQAVCHPETFRFDVVKGSQLLKSLLRFLRNDKLDVKVSVNNFISSTDCTDFHRKIVFIPECHRCNRVQKNKI